MRSPTGLPDGEKALTVSEITAEIKAQLDQIIVEFVKGFLYAPAAEN